MTTSSLSRDFRKINIEQYEDDFYEDEIEENNSPGPDANAVQTLISGGKVTVSKSKNVDIISFLHIVRTVVTRHVTVDKIFL